MLLNLHNTMANSLQLLTLSKFARGFRERIKGVGKSPKETTAFKALVLRHLLDFLLKIRTIINLIFCAQNLYEFG